MTKPVKKTNSLPQPPRGVGAEPPTELMKIVATKSLDLAKAKKTFAPKTVRELQAAAKAASKEYEDDELALEDAKTTKQRYRALKAMVRRMEEGNRDKLILFPVLVEPTGKWYRAVNFSALYYRYRLAPRIGRSCTLQKDTDRFATCDYAVAVVKIERLIEQVKDLMDIEPEMGEGGIYIFHLPQRISEEEVVLMQKTAYMQQEKLYTMMRPKAMSPELQQLILLSSV